MRAVAWSLVAFVAVAAAATGRAAGPLTLDVTFFANETITVTLPDGTQVGATSGAPTVIPAGYYTVQMTGPMGLPQGIPYFHLTGPGVDFLANLNEGGLESATDRVTFRPSSTYTWTDDAIPGVVHTFVTTADVQGAAPTTAVSPKKGAPTSDQDVVGSGIVPQRGTLTGAVSGTGQVTLAFKGKGVVALQAGTYRITVTDRSATSGFLLEKAGHPIRSVTGAPYVGTHSVSIDLTAGRWTIARGLGGKTAISFAVT
jgi:hypothetical protein